MRFGRTSENARFGIFLVLLGACFLMGGASRLDVTSLIILQPLAALCAGSFLVITGTIDWKVIRTPLLLLAALAGVIAAQLIPLPPSIWAALPGHAPFADSARAAGLVQPWRPISLTPDLTLASLVGLVVPLAALLGFAAIDPHRRHNLLLVLIVAIWISAFFGLAQVSGGPNSPFYLYRITNAGNAVGLFSNRNHQALLLAMGWPLLAVWATVPHGDRRQRAARRWIAVGLALFLLPLLLVTGSRAGLLLGAIGLTCGGLLWRWRRAALPVPMSRLERFAIPTIVAVSVLILVATIMFSRAEAVRRLLTLTGSDDTRVEAAPVLFEMAWNFFPIGSGFGSFDPVFRAYEPLQMLRPEYLNHAHNDLLEMAITGGIFGCLIVVLFLAWFAVQTWRAWRGQNASMDAALARAGSIMILLILLSSVVDYPLRTPLLMAIFAVCCGWLGVNREAQQPRARSVANPK